MLKIKATGNAVHIQYLTGKKQVWHFFTHHRIGINFIQINSTSRNKLFFKSCLSFDSKFTGA